jgi:hypothetical protein
MIIYGSRAVHIKSKQPKLLICPNCETQGSTLLSVFRKHAHIFWIPLFPLGKTGASECQHCKLVLEPKEMSGGVEKEYLKLKAGAKGPIWQFVGLFVIVVLTAWASYASEENAKRELEYVADPQVGDIYKYVIKKGSYSTLKVVEVTRDSVFVAPNDYEISRKSKVYKIDKEENYDDEVYGISKADIKEMHSSDEIFGIDR